MEESERGSKDFGFLDELRYHSGQCCHLLAEAIVAPPTPPHRHDF